MSKIEELDPIEVIGLLKRFYELLIIAEIVLRDGNKKERNILADRIDHELDDYHILFEGG